MENLMRNLLLAGLIISAAMVCGSAPLHAQSPPPNLETTIKALPQPGSRAAGELRPHDPHSTALLRSIVIWLSMNFDLAPTDALPRIAHESPTAMASRRYRSLPGSDSQPGSSADTGQETVALYDDRDNTIYLPTSWTGRTPAEVSVLVHEMVHHLQNQAKTKFECPQAREQLAYQAQQKWLGLFGRNLNDEFQIDPFTLLVMTRCMH
jgi:Domain of unknown function (DUF6647)